MRGAAPFPVGLSLHPKIVTAAINDTANRTADRVDRSCEVVDSAAEVRLGGAGNIANNLARHLVRETADACPNTTGGGLRPFHHVGAARAMSHASLIIQQLALDAFRPTASAKRSPPRVSGYAG
jgi:hypothetical protein